MQLINIKKENDITRIYYQLTFGHVSWWTSVHIIDVIIAKDFRQKDGKIHELILGGVNKTKELKEANYNMDKYQNPDEETGYISIYGYSSIVGKNVRYTIWNQLDKFLIEIEDETFIEKEGEHIYDRMVDSIELTAMINCAKEKYSSSLTNEERKVNKDNIEKNIISVECFSCHTKFEVNCSKIPSNQKTFYCKCPNCNTELKRANPKYIDNAEDEKKQTLSDRDELINSMKLMNNIRSLSEKERNEIIYENIIKVSKVLKEIKCDSSEYKLSQRQQATKNNAINKIKAKDFLEAYYEITDFIDDYGDRHNGKVFEIEKQEINNLISIIYNNIKQ